MADNELQYYFRAADVAVLPYRAVTTSGAAYLAFSFEVPIVAPRLGPFPELVGQGRGLLYDPATSDGLAGALRAACHLDTKAASAACRAFNRDHAWTRLARGHAALYRFACTGPGQMAASTATARALDRDS